MFHFAYKIQQNFAI